jgi:FlaA1/EpsC-like NDP-sugar epimerase
MLDNKSILITGGTGSLGRALTKTILERWPNVKRLVIFSRDEQKQFQMSQEYPDTKYKYIIILFGMVDILKKIIIFQMIYMMIYMKVNS